MVRSHLGYRNKKEAFKNKKQLLLKIATKLEELVPRGKDIRAKNTEYPYLMNFELQKYQAPCMDSFSELSVLELRTFVDFYNRMSTFNN